MTKKSINRRHFIGTSAGAAAVLSGMAKTSAAESSALALTPPARPPRTTLGKTDVTMSRLGLGTGMRGWNRQSDHTKLGFQKLVALFRHAYDRGVTFFDLADLYGTHLYCREALRSIPREKVAILTKLWWRYDGAENQPDAPRPRRLIRATIDRFRQEIGTDYIDIVLLHCMGTPTWDKELAPYMDVLAEEREKGHIRALGVSCHNFGAMETAARSPWVDVILARINPKGVKMDGTPEEVTAVLRKAKENGKSILGMKILGEGELVNERESCLQFAQSLGILNAMTIGCISPEQIDDILRLMEKYPAKEV